jgi:hypothetical protein
MLKKSVVFLFLSATVMADQSSQCIQFYVKTSGELAARLVEKKDEKSARHAARLQWLSEKSQFINELYFPMFIKQFESEFGTTLIPDFKEMFRKLLFEPNGMEKTDWDLLRSGFPRDTKVGEENPNTSPLKYYLNLNHLTIDKQEADAEAILSNLRGKRIELTQIEKVALRVVRVIGRDYDFFKGTELELSENRIKNMKARFLSVFSFDGKTLSDKEIDALYAGHVLNDDIMGTFRFDISQRYDFTRSDKKDAEGKPALYITNEMIADRNQRDLDVIEKWRNPVYEAQLKTKLYDPALRAALESLNKRIEEDPKLLESIKYVRLSVANLIGKEQPFTSSADFGQWLEKQANFFEAGLAKLKEPGVKEKLARMVEGMTRETMYESHVESLKSRLDLSKIEDRKILDFIQSELGNRLFAIVRDEYRRFEPSLFNRTPRVTTKSIEDAIKRNIDQIDDVVKLKRDGSYLFEAVYQFKLKRTGLTKAEAMEIFKLAQRNSQMRLASLVKFDPLARYGFCFARAYFFDVILQKHGVHRDSIKKVFIDGPMSGGLTGWSWHVANMVEREGGGFWVMDLSHGEPQSLTEWFNNYRDHKDEKGNIVQGASKDDRIKLFVAPGERFGRSYWGSQDFETSLKPNYKSVWNKFGADNHYFRDVYKNLDDNNYDNEVKDALSALRDGILDALKIGF